MAEHWDHASLLAAGPCVSPARSKAMFVAAAPAAAPSCAWSDASEPGSPLNGWEQEEVLYSRTFRQLEPSGIRHSGWLLKAAGDGSQRQWRRRFVYLTADRLCYTPDPDDGGPVRYLAVDRIPVRALPRGYGPKLGVTLVEDRQAQLDRSSLQFSPKKAGCVFSVACGSHTHFFAAPSPAEAKAWVGAVTSVWVQCVKHTSRSTHMPSATEAMAVQEARWHAESTALRRSLAEAKQQQLHEQTAAWQAGATAALAVPADEAVACYEIQVVTGSQPDAGTTAHVYLELCGAGGSSGEHRLMYREGGRMAFATGATDAFRLHCRPLGPLIKARVFHNNAGIAPAWFLEEVRVRHQGGDGRWTVFPCGRWLAVHQDDGRVMRELLGTAEQANPSRALVPQQPMPEPQPAAAERVAMPVWYTVAVCTSGDEGAGLIPADGSAWVAITLHGARSSSQRVQLPSQPGDFERGQEDVFRVQLPGVGPLEKLTIALNGGSEQAAWLVEQVEVTDEGTGETMYFPCGSWLGQAKGTAERSLLGSRANPRAALREAAHLRQQVEAVNSQLAAAQAELAAARAASTRVQLASAGTEAELAGKLAALQAEVGQLQGALVEAQQRAAAAEALVQQLQGALRGAEEQMAGLKKDQEAGQQRAAGDVARAAELAAQLQALHEELAQAQEAAAAAAARARRFEAEAQRSEAELDALRSQHERYRRDISAKAGDADGEVARLRAEAAARAAELREAKQAEAAVTAECERLERELVTERLRTNGRQKPVEKAASEPGPSATARLQASYMVRIHTSSEPPGAGTCRPVCLELLGSQGSTGPIRMEGARIPGGHGFAAGASDVFQLEALAVGELRQLNIWVDMEEAGDVSPGEAAWHLDSVEVAPAGAAQPSYFACRRWLDERCGYRAELAASTHNPHQEEAEYRVTVYTSSLPGCGTGGNVFVDLQGERAGSGVLTLRNKGGSFCPGQADEFIFRLPALGTLSELRVGHDGRRDWNLEHVEVADLRGADGTTYFFPCGRWVKGSGAGGAPAATLKLRGYTTDPAGLPVQYRLEVEVEGATGTLGPGSLRLTLFGSRGESGAQRLDASRAAPGRTLVYVFDAANVGQLERLRIGLAPASEDGPTRSRKHCGLLMPRLTVTDMVSGEAATFLCAEWLRSSDPYDFELDVEQAGQEEEVACRYRLEVQTSDARKAGTSDSVFVTLIGTACAIGPYQLSNIEAEHFQRGQLDIFEVVGAPDCGRLQQIEVRHDGTGKGNNWHLAWVKATNLTTGAVAMFKCNRWVDRRAPADPAIVAVVVSLPPDQAATAAGVERSTKDRLLLRGLGRSKVPLAGMASSTAAAALQAPQMQATRMEAELGGSPAEMGGMEGVESPGGLPGYRAVFHTSRICGSGTRAKVHFELTGSRGSSGVLHPVGTPKSFGSGRMDVFEYPNLPYLGELQSARVGTDGSGFFPGWRLQLLVVTHLPTGRVWQFSCFNWIDRKVNYSRWLTLDCVEQRPIYGNAAKLTSSGSPGITAWGSGLPAVTKLPAGLDGSNHAGSTHAPRQLQYPGSPGTYYRSSPSGSSSPQRAKRSPLGSPTLVQAQLWGGGSPTSHAMLRSGSGMPDSPLIGARR